MNDLRNAVFPSITSSSSLMMSNHHNHSGSSFFQHQKRLRNEVLSAPSCNTSSQSQSSQSSQSQSCQSSQQSCSQQQQIQQQQLSYSSPSSLSNSLNQSNPNNQIQPSSSTVVIGKGRIPKKAPGNRKLRSLVYSKIPKYAGAKSKMVKSSIVTDIYFAIEELCLKEGSAPPFVRYDGNCYTITSESVAREKITSTFRDYLHDRYKSSSKNKVAKRRVANKEKGEQKRKSRIEEAQQYQFPRFPQFPSSVVVDNNNSNNNNTNNNNMSQFTSQQNQQQQQQQQQHQQQLQQQIKSIVSNSKLLQFPNHLPRMTRIGTFSAPMFEFFGPVNRSLFDMVAPVPVPVMDCASTCSSSSSYQSSTFSADGQ